MSRIAACRRRGILGLVLAAVVVSAGPARAQGGAGSYAASFLKIPVGARLMSSPDAVAGMRPDASLMYSNPAFVAGMEHAEVFASTGEWLENLSFNSVGVAMPLGKGGTVLAVGTTLLYSGGLNGYDDGLNVVSQDSYYNLGMDLTVGHRFANSGISGAMGVTYLREHILPETGSGFAFHAGASYWLGRNLFHAAARDLGGSVSYASGTWSVAPEFLAGGGHAFDSPLGQFYAGAQVSRSYAYGTRLQIGVDYRLNTMFTLRTGLNDNLDGAQPQSPFNAGFGMRYGPMSLEYAYTPQEYFSSAHTFTLAYAFGGSMHSSRGAAAGAPVGDLAPPVSDSVPQPPAKGAAAASEVVFVLVAGSHAWLESARSEARALELLGVPGHVESEGPRFRVVVGRYRSFDEAERDRSRYARDGHAFQIIAR